MKTKVKVTLDYGYASSANTNRCWLWPDRTIGKRESRVLRDEHNVAIDKLFNAENTIDKLIESNDKVTAQRDELLAALKQTLDALYNETAFRHKDSPWITETKAKAQTAIHNATN